MPTNIWALNINMLTGEVIERMREVALHCKQNAVAGETCPTELLESWTQVALALGNLDRVSAKWIDISKNL